MIRLKNLALAAALAAAGAGVAAAEPALDSVHWQAGRVSGARVASWQDIKLLQSRGPKLDARLRARLTLKNQDVKSEEGLLLRYVLTARVAPSGSAGEGSWAVPFAVEEKRVPKVGAGKTIEVALDASRALDLYAARLVRAGWWLDRVKIQVMIEPRQGAKALETVEETLEVKP